MRWKRAGKIKSNKHTVLYSGNEKAFENGVGIIINEKIEKSLKGYWPISDRVIAAKFQWTPFDFFVIQIYAPTTASEGEKVHEFYGEINCALKQCKSRDMLIVMGDFNAKVGKGASGTAIGPFGLGERNERGDLFAEWCEANKLIVANTWFENHNRRLYTWISPGDRARNQIDYFCINQRQRNAVKCCKTYPSADCNSDHVPVIAKVYAKLKKIATKKAPPSSITTAWNQLLYISCAKKRKR